ncbi:MAG TPA: Stk1 family PASTA domain-containing Ser/Thr kinase [Candidatus Corynebacterium gallistercoris]|uniref:non-specific serine/threonine protein kinase n=1 Tax=Candidatus Corynebacterium gallistercoris TaxID=2838530 RepID=A0A9D1RZJ7_9CORY|nr:Stk1 family PASTA domain-containing Ser/Thr kinase [Candidatus Corynebacterium gallistercoris]
MSRLVPGDLLEDRYRIGARIATGGMSTVYTAVDSRLDREVAVKVMDPELATKAAFRTRFEREARAVARLNHPSLVNVFDQGVDRDYVFLVMELVQGGSLRELLKERGPMPPHAAMAVMKPVLTALSVAHATGMIHRDIKPDNVLISDSHQVKLADFGLVRAINAVGDHTSGQVIGTVGYLSPEQVRGEKLTQASDVYSAGILLFELITGTTPFKGESPTTTAMARLSQDVPAPSSFIDGVPHEIDQLVAAACHRDPSQRIADGAEFLSSVEHVTETLNIPSFKVPAPRNSAVHRALESADFGDRRSWDDESMHTRAVDVPATGETALQNYREPHYEAPVAPPAVASPPQQHQPPQPQQPPAQPTMTNRSAGKTVLWVCVLIALVASVAIGAWWLSSGRYGDIPNVVGMDQTTAQATVEEAGFTSAFEERYDDAAADGKVMGTDPPFGERATRGSQVAVLVSLGQPTVPSPGTAESITSYKRKLEERTLRLKEGDQVYSDSVMAGHIAEVSPSEGTTVRTGSTVTVHVSKGKKPVKVPGVKNQDRQRAMETIEKAGLTVSEVVEEFHADIDGGDAIRTDPAQGTKVPGGSEVTLVISNAVEVPDVEGMSLNEARRMLTEAGVTVVEGAPVQDNDVSNGDVARQSPAAGTKLDPADAPEVEIRVSNSQRVPLVFGMTGDAARERLEDAGFRVELNGSASGLVYSQSPGPGSRSQAGAVVRISTL